MSKQAYEDKLQSIEVLRHLPEPDAVAGLKKALRDRNGFVTSKAAAIVADRQFTALLPDLCEAFDRCLAPDPTKSDPQCWAKNAIAKALKDLGHTDSVIYLRGARHIQMEPVWAGQADTAATLRGACLLALIDCRIDDITLLTILSEAMADPEKPVRIDAALALARAGIPEAVALLRMKALIGDAEPEVIGQCLASILALTPRDGIEFALRFLHGDDEELQVEAAAALAQCTEPAAFEALKEFWKRRLSPRLREALRAFLAASPHRDAAKEFITPPEQRVE